MVKKKILITGSNGFLGKLAVEHFSINNELVLVDLVSSDNENSLILLFRKLIG